MDDRAFAGVRLAEREHKPRTMGITYVRDVGLSADELGGYLETSGSYIDIVKFGSFAPRLLSRELLRRKVDLCSSRDVAVALGGPVLEIASMQGPDAVLSVLHEAQDLGIRYVEVSRGVAILSPRDMCRIVAAAVKVGLEVIAEAGLAYGIGPDDLVSPDVKRVIDCLLACRDAGATYLLLESEGLTESRHEAEMRWDLVAEVLHAIPAEDLIVEADDPLVWNRYIRDYGPDTNFFVDCARVLRLEAARLGGWAQPTWVVSRVGSFPESALHSIPEPAGVGR